MRPSEESLGPLFHKRSFFWPQVLRCFSNSGGDVLSFLEHVLDDQVDLRIGRGPGATSVEVPSMRWEPDPIISDTGSKSKTISFVREF